MTTSHRFLLALKAVAALAVAVPALWVAFMALIETLADPGDALNTAFHLGLGMAMLLIVADFVAAIHRTPYAMSVLALGCGGFVAATAGAILSELLGPPVLLVLLVAVGSWAFLLWRAKGEGGGVDTALSVEPLRE